MGLAVYFSLWAEAPRFAKASTAKEVVGALRVRAKELGFSRVGPVVEHANKPVTGEERPGWTECFGQSAREFCIGTPPRVAGTWVMPDEGWCFPAQPGEGTGIAAVGLGRFPAEIAGVATQAASVPDGYYWSGRCHTQYASLRGNDYFLECHRRLIALLDTASEAGLRVQVNDTGGYWEKRDEAALLAEMNRVNRIAAAIVGRFKDIADERGEDPSSIHATILKHPRFEYLEAEGQEEISKRKLIPGGEPTDL